MADGPASGQIAQSFTVESKCTPASSPSSDHPGRGIGELHHAGAHQVIVYGDGTQPGDINTSLLVPPAIGGAAILINDPNNRIYRGLDFSVLPLLSIPPSPPNPLTPPFLMDRVEVVHFPKPGTYLVICGVVFHFVNDGMFGFVTVLP